MSSRPRTLVLSILACLLSHHPALAQWQVDGTPVCVGTWGKQTPAMVPDGSGGAYVMWEDDRSTPSRIFAQRLNASGVPQWAANGVPLDSSRPYSQTGCTAVIDKSGGVIAAWTEYTGPNVMIVTARLDASGAPMWSTIVCNAPGERRYISMVSDGVEPIVIGSSGGAVLAWNDDRNGSVFDTDVYAQHVDGNGITLWPPDGVPVSTAPGAQWYPLIVTDGIGSITSPKSTIVTWADARSDVDDVYAQRMSAGGVAQWTANGVAVCATDSIQDPQAATFISSGNVMVAWDDRRNGPRAFDLFVQRVGASGPWPGTPTGVPLCVSSGRSTQVQLVQDGKGGAIGAWTDDRNGGLADIYAQRIDGSGNPRWVTNGVQVCGAPWSQSLPMTVTDISGGAVIAWTDYRKQTESDIYAERIDSSGVSLWAPNGIRLCRADGNQTTRAIVGDGSGGAIVLWEDGRSVNPGLYAQHVSATGAALAVKDRVTPDFRLSAAPNPTSAAASIRFELRSARPVTAEIVGVDGRRVRSLANGETLSPGAHTLEWDGRDAGGGLAPCGVYFLRVTAGRESGVRRLLVLR